MQFDVLTLFPEIISSYWNRGVLSRALDQGYFQLFTHQIRDYSQKKYGSVDGSPYGGGAGMVMQYEPLKLAWQAAQSRIDLPARTILFSASGSPWDQVKALKMSQEKRIVLICGRYEGVDQRFVDSFVDEEVSLGPFILSGGEIPALAFMDSIIRLIPGVLGNDESIAEESFSKKLDFGLEYPQYTKPGIIDGLSVPNILLSGDHRKIQEWRQEQSRLRTVKRKNEERDKS